MKHLTLKNNGSIVFETDYSKLESWSDNIGTYLRFSIDPKNFFDLACLKYSNVKLSANYEGEENPVEFKSYRINEVNNEVFYQLHFVL